MLRRFRIRFVSGEESNSQDVPDTTLAVVIVQQMLLLRDMARNGLVFWGRGMLYDAGS